MPAEFVSITDRFLSSCFHRSAVITRSPSWKGGTRIISWAVKWPTSVTRLQKCSSHFLVCVEAWLNCSIALFPNCTTHLVTILAVLTFDPIAYNIHLLLNNHLCLCERYFWICCNTMGRNRTVQTFIFLLLFTTQIIARWCLLNFSLVLKERPMSLIWNPNTACPV